MTGHHPSRDLTFLTVLVGPTPAKHGTLVWLCLGDRWLKINPGSEDRTFKMILSL